MIDYIYHRRSILILFCLIGMSIRICKQVNINLKLDISKYEKISKMTIAV